MMYIVLMSMMLTSVVYLLFYMLYMKEKQDMEVMSCYECGFDPNSFTRLTFSYRFFMISILFIIFDVEISLMLPIPFLMENYIGMWLFIMFVVILIIGLLYEYQFGSLDWMDVRP